MKENKLVELSMDFSVEIINLVKMYFFKSYVNCILQNSEGEINTREGIRGSARVVYLEFFLHQGERTILEMVGYRV